MENAVIIYGKRYAYGNHGYNPHKWNVVSATHIFMISPHRIWLGATFYISTHAIAYCFINISDTLNGLYNISSGYNRFLFTNRPLRLIALKYTTAINCNGIVLISMWGKLIKSPLYIFFHMRNLLSNIYKIMILAK